MAGCEAGVVASTDERVCGQVVLAFASSRAWFQGRFSTEPHRSLFATREELEDWDAEGFHKCCYGHNPLELPTFFRLTLIEQLPGTQPADWVSRGVVAMTNGDNAILQGQGFDFTTDEFLVDDEARALVAAAFPNMATQTEPLVCIGHLELHKKHFEPPATAPPAKPGVAAALWDE
ncbi:uncharacterized protein MONBRDRAFT_7313 [Monosiga brevicollis MX1]|uniref:Uncharacterized protein n=1 Tax=Monosiga brevicollis TaxID=81824 RepID=A9UWL0_MONBE|nr:uncharacterized protein MONBRDRAFT_7313 [Monosiga brevicollis MX1]EDQ90063.1 predicted protein [Monosiga brevicollis MX1]|eukprot:XP_001744830.1 hypothetical protein [Monosiga brevicollis MX1]